MHVILIAAMAENGVLGRDGDLPWHLPADLRHFKTKTRGHAVVMGRKTWESIGGRPLPKRRNVVLTRNADFRADGADIAPDLDTALALLAGEDEVYIVGGAGVYAAAMPRADRLELTRVHAMPEGDVRFPPLDLTHWHLVERHRHPADECHAHALTFETWERESADTASHPQDAAVLTCGEVDHAELEQLVRRYGMTLSIAPDGAPIPGTYWGEPEAGIRQLEVWIRSDTPVHSLLHEMCHTVCAAPERRAALDTDAGGDDLEENGVCYLEIVLADEIPGVGAERIQADMDRWGYSFRLGSTRAWFEGDAEEARAWLETEGIVDGEGRPTWRMRA